MYYYFLSDSICNFKTFLIWVFFLSLTQRALSLFLLFKSFLYPYLKLNLYPPFSVLFPLLAFTFAFTHSSTFAFSLSFRLHTQFMLDYLLSFHAMAVSIL